MSGVDPVWRLPNLDRGTVRDLVTGLGVPGIVGELLAGRGVTSISDARAFLESDHEPLSDPMSLTDMDRAVDRLQTARDRGEHVRIFGDYDVDGMAATAIATRGLRRFGIATVSHDMPNRMVEGYGINADSVRTAAEDGVQVIVTVDNGISAHDAAKAATECGIDLIVTDHHRIDGDLPSVFAVVNPQRDDAAHPGSEICGSGVAFKLCTALTGEESDLDLVALATVADVVPLRRENRMLVSRGLRNIADRAHPGIEALARRAKLSPREIRAEHIAFQLAPRLNASGRLSDGSDALALLLSDSFGEAEAYAAELDRLNVERRAVEDGILQDALSMLEADGNGQAAIVLAQRGWHPGVIGIVSARLMNRLAKPVVLIAIDDNGVGRGSGRSTADLHLAETLSACDEHLEKHGGHPLAAGLTVMKDRIEAFVEAFQAEAAQRMPNDPTPPDLPLDAVVSFTEIDNQLLNDLERLEPYGASNPAPLLGTFGAKIVRDSARELNGGHLRCDIEAAGRRFGAIGFGICERWCPDDLPDTIDLAYRPQFNTWRGETSIQLQLKALRPSSA